MTATLEARRRSGGGLWPLLVLHLGVPKQPKPLMGGNEAFKVLATIRVRRGRTPGQHHLQDPKEILRDFEIPLIARMVEGNEDLVRKAARMAWCGRPASPAFRARRTV